MAIPIRSDVCPGSGDLTYDLNLGQYICTHAHPQVTSHVLFWVCFLLLFAAFIFITTLWLLLRHPITIKFPTYLGGLVAKLTTTITFIISPPPPPPNPIVVAKSTIQGAVGVPLNDNIGISGGNGGPYQVTADLSALPGVTLGSDGSVTGTPTQQTPPEGVAVTVNIADSQG